MREIKFRAWNGVEMSEPFDLNKGDPDTFPLGLPLMQYTGLEDKNGKEIYEGDIIRLQPLWEASVVEFGHQDIGHDFQGIGFYTREKNGGQFNLFANEETEVIGNIYSNPELFNN